MRDPLNLGLDDGLIVGSGVFGKRDAFVAHHLVEHETIQVNKLYCVYIKHSLTMQTKLPL